MMVEKDLITVPTERLNGESVNTKSTLVSVLRFVFTSPFLPSKITEGVDMREYGISGRRKNICKDSELK